jgi:plastocyanin
MPVKRSLIAWVALVVTLVVLAPEAVAGGGDDHARGTASRARVRIDDNVFRPRRITVERGTVVRWVNIGGNNHTSTSSAWNSGVISPGDSFRRRFRRRGTFSYHCTIHANMMGTIRVTRA